MAVQVAIVLDAIGVTDHGAERRPWAELVATTEIPWEVMTIAPVLEPLAAAAKGVGWAAKLF